MKTLSPIQEYFERCDAAFHMLTKAAEDQARLEAGREDRIRRAVIESLPPALEAGIIVDLKQMRLTIRILELMGNQSCGAWSTRIEADFSAADWVIKIQSPWTIYLHDKEIDQVADLDIAVGILRHHLSQDNEEISGELATTSA